MRPLLVYRQSPIRLSVSVVLAGIIHDHAGEYFVNHVPPLSKDALSDWPSVLKPIPVNNAKNSNPEPLVAEQLAAKGPVPDVAGT